LIENRPVTVDKDKPDNKSGPDNLAYQAAAEKEPLVMK
jgi:hypothetical protein